MYEYILFGVLFHLVGDYLLQNDHIAATKTESSKSALIHVLLYGILFAFLLGISWGLLVIIVSHFFIDRFRLAVCWIKLINWNWDSSNFGFSNDKPVWMSVWLMIIYDNIFHVLINSVVIYFELTNIQ